MIFINFLKVSLLLKLWGRDQLYNFYLQKDSLTFVPYYVARFLNSHFLTCLGDPLNGVRLLFYLFWSLRMTFPHEFFRHNIFCKMKWVISDYSLEFEIWTESEFDFFGKFKSVSQKMLQLAEKSVKSDLLTIHLGV